MDRRNDLPPTGIFRDERKFEENYHQRLYWVAGFQLTLSIIYLVGITLFLVVLMPDIPSTFNTTYNVLNKTDNQTLGTLTITVYDPATDVVFSRLYFWFALTSVGALFPILSSILLIWAAWKSAEKLRARILCNYSRVINLAFLLYEIVVFVFMYQQWGVALYFLLYRFWFEYEIQVFSTIITTMIQSRSQTETPNRSKKNPHGEMI